MLRLLEKYSVVEGTLRVSETLVVISVASHCFRSLVVLWYILVLLLSVSKRCAKSRWN